MTPDHEQVKPNLGETVRIVAVEPPRHVRGTTWVERTHLKEPITGRFRTFDKYFKRQG